MVFLKNGCLRKWAKLTEEFVEKFRLYLERKSSDFDGNFIVIFD
jgi:hypothetical protein